ncbi:MAG TPA: 50S ribosomal protein L11 methyltransferase [Steroidobacter sp.]|jgi:ribosomal protein L11 methyltransferase|nr:50S ribosomal protein L11 methyltransferase [Steroidobacter sp.]
MPFLQLTLTVGEADPAQYEEALLSAGAASITLEDAADDPVLEPAPGSTPLWPRVRIKALFAADTAPDRVLAALQAELPQPLPHLTFEVLADRVWEREWLKDFRPMKFGRRVWICPGGQQPDSALTREAGVEPCLIELDPGLAFGTGTHPTTALCLEWLDSADVAGKQVIDYGCGSGVLAIAALKLGAAHALALDIDPQALTAARDNALRNGVADRLAMEFAPPAALERADIVLANILAGPLQELAPAFAGLLIGGGRLVLSGILREQAAAVARRYAAWFDIAPPTHRDDWVRLDGVRRAC